MRKKLLALALGLVVVLTTACGAKSSENKNEGKKEETKVETKVVKIGVSPEPHQKIVELVKEDLEKEAWNSTFYRLCST